MPLIVQESEVMTGSEAEKRWGEDRETTSGQTWTRVPADNEARKWGGGLSACATMPPKMKHF